MQGVPTSGHATVDALADQWGKILAVIMRKQGLDHLVVTTEDIEAIGPDGRMELAITVQELEDGLHIRLMKVDDAVRMAKENKTGFGKS